MNRSTCFPAKVNRSMERYSIRRDWISVGFPFESKT